MQSKAQTVVEYLAELPPERRAALEAVRKVILANLDDGYEEGMQYGMIGYYVPHRVFPAGYHCDPKQPVPFAGLAAQKNHMSLYLMCTYCVAEEAEWFRNQWAKTGKRLDMGKSCVRFKRIEDLALDVIAAAIRRATLRKFIKEYEAAVGKAGTRAKRSPTKPKRSAAKRKDAPGRKAKGARG